MARKKCTITDSSSPILPIEEMQTVLDEWLIAYNTKRPHQGRNMNGRTPIKAFQQGLPKPGQKEVTGKTKQPKLSAA